MVNVGIDLHKTQFTICVRDGKGEERYGSYPTTEGGYKGFLGEMAALQEAGEAVRVGVESTGNTRYFKSRMEAAGIEVKVINTLKFKVVNESVKKTDKHDAATIAEFLEKEMLPESFLCSRESEQMRRLLKARTTLVRAEVVMKNQIHALVTGEGMEDTKASLQSKRGRQRVLEALKEREMGPVVQPLLDSIERLEENVKAIEGELRVLAAGDRMVALLVTIPGCGEVCAWTIRAYTDDIGRFASAKKYTAYAGLVPWVQDSNERVRHGKITKRGPEELRTALVQVVMGMRRQKKRTAGWRLMERHEVLKRNKGTGKSIVATARKVGVIIWHMLSAGEGFNEGFMVDRKLAEKAEKMSRTTVLAGQAGEEGTERRSEVLPRGKGAAGVPEKKLKPRKAGVTGQKRKKSARGLFIG
jgi:transposase